MTRFFFDVVRTTSRTYDFHGQYFKTLAEAREMAEIVCFDLACSDKDDCGEGNIVVRDAGGAELLSLPVGAPDQVFA